VLQRDMQLNNDPENNLPAYLNADGSSVLEYSQGLKPITRRIGTLVSHP